MITFLSALLIVASGITPVIRTSGGGSCTPVYAETTWDNITGWTQNGAGCSADATNDELDCDPAFNEGTEFIIHDTNTTTDEDQCLLVQLVSHEEHADGIGIVLRAPSGWGSSEWAYNLYWWASTSVWTWRTIEIADEPSSFFNHHTDSSASYDLSAGDYFSACVSDTGASTKFEFWYHGASDPGDCRGDWGTADWTETGGCSGSCVDSANTKSGFYVGIEAGGSNNLVEYDEFALSDY